MRILTPIAMLLAVVATAVVGVCELTQVRHLQYEVWRTTMRHDIAQQHIERLAAASRAARAPRALLPAHVASQQEDATWDWRDAGAGVPFSHYDLGTAPEAIEPDVLPVHGGPR